MREHRAVPRVESFIPLHLYRYRQIYSSDMGMLNHELCRSHGTFKPLVALRVLADLFLDSQMIALTTSLVIRLSGIALASFSSGLGELTFLQLSTRYSHSNASGHGVGWFASGTGGAGFVGAIAWWIVRPLGVKGGLSTLSPLPWGMLLSYLFILPTPAAVQAEHQTTSYTAVPTSENEDEVVAHLASAPVAPDAGPTPYDPYDPTSAGAKHVKLSLTDKFNLLKPMLPVYILPLFLYVQAAPHYKGR